MISIKDTNLQEEIQNHHIIFMYTHLLAVLAVPDVNAAVAGARDDKLGVGGEGSLQGELLGVQVTWG